MTNKRQQANPFTIKFKTMAKSVGKSMLKSGASANYKTKASDVKKPVLKASPQKDIKITKGKSK